MGNTFYMPFEPAFMQWLQNLLGEGGAKAISIFSALGEEVALVLILGFIYWCFDKEFGKYIGINAVIGIVLNPMLKNIALRIRPYMVHEEIQCFRPVDPAGDIYDVTVQGYSFPSGHSMNSTIIYGSIGRYAKKPVITVLSVLIPLFVGLSRVVVGVHYPTDVLTGWVIGLLVIFLIPFLYTKFGSEKRWLINLIIFIVAAIGIFYCRTTDYFSGLGLMAGFFVGIEIEDRFVKFESTRNPLEIILRLAGGLLIFVVGNKLMKMPFSPEFLNSPTMPSFLFRTFRYFVIQFLLIGVYPYIFRFFPNKQKTADNT